ncbi:uncharacterized protein LOC109833805 isoform X4 [Asparagus officinalis]|uniref:uncharacterized protein LOC109833805 isoform X4 n=2 Tax=Asparagus officinalis TaxID=4686 RepID=UPI00098E7D94|nr:uncharacterized protein LOC109833805 isoform X4 [Asparagus officinalis]
MTRLLESPLFWMKLSIMCNPCKTKLRDREQEKLILDSTDKTTSIFKEFMLRVAKFDELVDIAHQYLNNFCQELEKYKRPQVHKTSPLVDHIIEANQTNRMKVYIEAGSRHRYDDIKNISMLYSCTQRLQEHLTEVKVLLHELESLKEDAIDIAQRVNRSTTQFLDMHISDKERLSFEEEDMVESLHLQDKSTSHATLMAVIYNMFRLDYAMQEKIINSINLVDTKSEQLESYCFMWKLRPYINDDVMRQGWKLVP